MVRVSLGHVARLVSQQSLDLVQVDSRLDQSRCERMAKVMEAKVGNLGSISRFAKLSNKEPHLELIAQRRFKDTPFGNSCSRLLGC